MSNTQNSIVISKLPDAGLGNKLFTWSHGLIFAKKNNLNHFSVGWTKVKIGPILRRETSLRLYRDYFKRVTTISQLKLLFLKRTKIIIPILYKDCTRHQQIQKNAMYTFNQVPHYSDYFLGIRENREMVVKSFFNSLHKKIYQKYLVKPAPTIGIHIRMGDFRKVAAEIDFSKIGQARTPLNYFIDTIRKIREVADTNLPVTIFTDGREAELKEVLELENVQLAEDDLDILQMLHLSKSQILILSAGSTFGQWAAYLSNGAIINHFQHFHSYIRPKEANLQSYEGVIKDNSQLELQFINYIKNLKND
ncbi:MAG: alpha-1,2-fucosyltransferase [Chitinophagaceae bacterium]